MSVNYYNYSKDVMDVVNMLRGGDKEIYYFGYNRVMQYFQFLLSKQRQRISRVFDSNPELQNTAFDNRFLIESPEKIIDIPKSEYVFVCFSQHAKEIEKKIKSYGVDEDKIICVDTSVGNNLMKESLNSSVDEPSGKKLDVEAKKRIALDILRYFKGFCDENDIKFCLAEGTLLGAIRHKGFIPWDDDVDVHMTYDEYKKFISCWKDTDKYTLLCKERGNFPYLYAKIACNDTIGFRDYYPIQVELGQWIDIFPITGVNHRNITDDDLKYMRKVENEIFCTSVYTDYVRSNDFEYMKKEINKIIEKNNFYSIDPLNSQYVWCGLCGTWEVCPWIVESSVFKKTEFIEFEGEMYPGPIGMDALMRERYGDYMQLPPENERINHNYEIWYK